TAVPVRAGFDREHHALLDRAPSGLVRVRRLVRPRTDTVGDRMRRLLRKPRRRDAGSDQAVELGEARSGTAVVECVPVDAEERVEQLVVAWLERARADVLRMVAPVAIRADPDLEECRLVLLHRPVIVRREGPDSWARPDEREAECELDLPFPARALAVHEALPERRGLALLHPRLQLARDVPHRPRGDLICEPHA